MSQDVVQDWENREFIETVEVAVRKCVDFLNNFHESAKYRLSVVDARLSTLERKLDFLEASLENCDPSKRQAKQTQFKGSIFDPEIRQKLIAQNEQKRKQNQRLFTKTVVAPNESMKNRPIVNTGPSQPRQQPRQQPQPKQQPPKQPAVKQQQPKQSAPKQSAPKQQPPKQAAPASGAGGPPPPNPMAAKKVQQAQKKPPPNPASGAGGPPPPNPMQNKKAAPVQQQQKPPPVPGGPPKAPSIPGGGGGGGGGGPGAPPPNPVASKPPPNPAQKAQEPPPNPVVQKPPSAPGAAAPPPPNPGANKPPPAPGGSGGGGGPGAVPPPAPGANKPPPAPGGPGSGPGAGPGAAPPASNASTWPNKGNQIDILTLKEGTGPIPGAQSAVEIEYTGHLPSGKQFIKHREVIQLGKKQNIKGLEQAVTRIKVGSMIKLWIPARLAYGARGAGNLIPPNADLTFQLQLHRIVKQ